jgi:serine phosphatase RsbU (regulator of sigma subunit)
MHGSPRTIEAVLEVTRPGSAPEFVTIRQTPFLIGRSAEGGNNLLLDDGRISRRCAAIVQDGGGFRLGDRGHRLGIFVNGQKVEQTALRDGDVIEFGLQDSYRIVFHIYEAHQVVEAMLTRFGSFPASGASLPSGGLSKLNLLLEATSLLHSALPLDSVLGAMLDHAIAITHAERGILLAPDADGSLKVRHAHGSDGQDLAPESISPSQTAMRRAIQQRAGVITEDLNVGGLELQSAQSVMMQGLRAVVAIPLFAQPRSSSGSSPLPPPSELLGLLYLDSRRPAAFSNLDRQILDALGAEAASILDNARLMEHERERQRLEQELTIGHQIQQALLPRGLSDFSHLAIAGTQVPCHAVGGDYFDVFPLTEERTAFLIADVAGKGLGAALLATMLQGALSGMTLGVEPVKVLNHVNRFLCGHSEVGRYATMFFGIVDRDGGLEYIFAGHPSPLVVRGGKVNELYSGGSFPVGLFETAEFTAARVQLEPGDTLVLFTDGVTDAEGPTGEFFDDERLRTVVTSHGEDSVEGLHEGILAAIRDFTRGAAQSDDITLLTVRYRRPEKT